jgi:hypothetical protein
MPLSNPREPCDNYTGRQWGEPPFKCWLCQFTYKEHQDRRREQSGISWPKEPCDSYTGRLMVGGPPFKEAVCTSCQFTYEEHLDHWEERRRVMNLGTKPKKFDERAYLVTLTLDILLGLIVLILIVALMRG